MPGLTVQGQIAGDVPRGDIGFVNRAEEEKGPLRFPPKVVRRKEEKGCYMKPFTSSSPLCLSVHALICYILLLRSRAVLALCSHRTHCIVVFLCWIFCISLSRAYRQLL